MFRNLRILVTEKCDFKCEFCHRDGLVDSHFDELNAEEFRQITEEAVKRGVRTVKISGGEPTSRPDIVEIVKMQASVPAIEFTSMTTNASGLEKKARDLKDAGLGLARVSLFSTKNSTYMRLVNKGGDLINHTLSAVEECLNVGLPVQLNAVLIKDILEPSEIKGFVELSRRYGVVVKFIEMIVPPWKKDLKWKYVDPAVLERGLKLQSSEVIPLSPIRKRYVFSNGAKIDVQRYACGQPDGCSICLSLLGSRISPSGDEVECPWRIDWLTTYEFLRAKPSNRLLRAVQYVV